jgi:hypothetical protein
MMTVKGNKRKQLRHRQKADESTAWETKNAYKSWEGSAKRSKARKIS